MNNNIRLTENFEIMFCIHLSFCFYIIYRFFFCIFEFYIFFHLIFRFSRIFLTTYFSLKNKKNSFLDGVLYKHKIGNSLLICLRIFSTLIILHICSIQQSQKGYTIIVKEAKKKKLRKKKKKNLIFGTYFMSLLNSSFFTN